MELQDLRYNISVRVEAGKAVEIDRAYVLKITGESPF